MMFMKRKRKSDKKGGGEGVKTQVCLIKRPSEREALRILARLALLLLVVPLHVFTAFFVISRCCSCCDYVMRALIHPHHLTLTTPNVPPLISLSPPTGIPTQPTLPSRPPIHPSLTFVPS